MMHYRHESTLTKNTCFVVFVLLCCANENVLGISLFQTDCFILSAYRAVKAKYRSGHLWIASDDMTSTQMRMNWSIVAEVLAAEAGEAHVKRRTFPIPKFIRFLCTGRHPANSLNDRVHAHPDNT